MQRRKVAYRLVGDQVADDAWVGIGDAAGGNALCVGCAALQVVVGVGDHRCARAWWAKCHRVAITVIEKRWRQQARHHLVSCALVLQAGQQVVVGTVHRAQARRKQRTDWRAVKVGKHPSPGVNFGDLDLLKNLAQVSKGDGEICGF